ncbi:TRAP transporter substrate-binding protein DctP [Hoeflea sp.]|uniref:TRAP transporter substrate-binding protein n=1 Tax=Hoeflea sp. TaxID=1940281 RepID=UPI00199A03EF|nr:TRAP transporter substrate-binding protein DctP [Hoeflea sp.]MBC7285676.1 TRAP transporter substrate-binding protein DctP [Hoeflea sp.]
MMKPTALALGCALALTAAPATAQTKLDVAIFYSETDAFAGAFRKWAEDVAAATDGRVELTPHYGSSLVSITGGFAAARDGIVPITTSAAGVVSGQIPAMAFLEIMGGIPGDREQSKEVGLALDDEMEAMFAAEDVDYIWMQPAFGGLVACREDHLKTPDDWAGKKVRTAGRWQSEQLLALGAVPTTIDPAEQYIALRQGTVDCVLSNNTLALALRLHEVGLKITQLRQPVNVLFYLADPRSMARLSDEDRAAIKRAGLDAQIFATDYLLDRQQEASDTMAAEGADIHVLTDSELAAFKEAVRPVLDKITEAAGEAGAPLRAALESSW